MEEVLSRVRMLNICCCGLVVECRSSRPQNLKSPQNEPSDSSSTSAAVLATTDLKPLNYGSSAVASGTSYC